MVLFVGSSDGALVPLRLFVGAAVGDLLNTSVTGGKSKFVGSKVPGDKLGLYEVIASVCAVVGVAVGAAGSVVGSLVGIVVGNACLVDSVVGTYDGATLDISDGVVAVVGACVGFLVTSAGEVVGTDGASVGALLNTASDGGASKFVGSIVTGDKIGLYEVMASVCTEVGGDVGIAGLVVGSLVGTIVVRVGSTVGNAWLVGSVVEAYDGATLNISDGDALLAAVGTCVGFLVGFGTVPQILGDFVVGGPQTLGIFVGGLIIS